jgi:hypothetical protein
VTNAIVYGNPEPRFDGATKFDGSHLFNASAARIFNLFDVAIGYDLLGSLNPAGFMTAVGNQIDRLRAAGTHLRLLTLTASVMGDVMPAPADSMVEQLIGISLIGTGSSSDSGILTIPTLRTAPSSVDSAIGILTTGESVTQILAGSGSFTATAVIIHQGSGVFAGQGSMVLSSVRAQQASATLAGSGSFTGDSIPTLFASAFLQGSGALFADAKPYKFATATLHGTSSFTGKATLLAAGKATLAGSGLFIATGSRLPLDPFQNVFDQTFGGP